MCNKRNSLAAIILIAFAAASARSSTAETDSSFTDADYAAHVKELRKKAADDKFTVIVTPPFVVIGDEAPAAVKRRADGTVAWAVKKLKDAYFSKDPREILDIWLFKDKDSYEKNAQRLFDKKPDTPFGYYLRPGSRLGDEHCHRRRHPGSRNSASLHGGQFSRLPRMAQ